MKPWKLLLLLLIVTFSSSAQETQYINYTPDDGLPSSETYAVIQDSLGYIWVATDNGVSRFDGYKFKNFSIEDGLVDKVVLKLYLDYKGRIWFIHSNNKLSYFLNDSIHQYKFNDSIPKNAATLNSDYFGEVDIESIAVDSNDNLIALFDYTGTVEISNNGDVKYFKTETDAIYEVRYDSSFRKHYNIFNDKKHKKFKKNTKMKLHFDNTNYSFYYPEFAERFIKMEKHNDELFWSFGNIICRFSKSNSSYVEFPNKFRTILLKSEGSDVWISTTNQMGVMCYKNADIEKKPYKQYLKDYTVTYLYRDKENGLWLSTLEKGLFYIPNEEMLVYKNTEYIKEQDFSHLFATKDNEILVSVSNKRIYKFAEKKLANLFEEKIIHNCSPIYFNNIPIVFSSKGTLSLKKSYSKKNIHKVYNKRYKIYNKQTRIFKNIHPISSQLILLGNSWGMHVQKIDYQENPYYEASFFPEIYNIYINKFTRYKNNKILAATRKGLYCVTPDTINVLKTKIESFNIKNPKLKTRIDDIEYCNYNDTYWLGTKESGILVWDDKTDSVFSINHKNVLNEDWVTSIFIHDSIIWAGTKNGLYKISLMSNHKLEFKIRLYNKNHGLPSNEINDIIMIDSVVYISTQNGLCVFNDNLIKENDINTPIYISNIKVNEKNARIKSEYKFNYEQNNITIRYVGLAYKKLGEVNYKFRLEGSDTTWSRTNSREVRFPKLSPGKYTFEVKAQNEDGYWSKEPARVSD